MKRASITETLTSLFEYQRFANNRQLAELIDATTERYYGKSGSARLNDSELDVWAAGNLDAMRFREDVDDGKKE